jgi:hypothetical protein
MLLMLVEEYNCARLSHHSWSRVLAPLEQTRVVQSLAAASRPKEAAKLIEEAATSAHAN